MIFSNTLDIGKMVIELARNFFFVNDGLVVHFYLVFIEFVIIM